MIIIKETTLVSDAIPATHKKTTKPAPLLTNDCVKASTTHNELQCDVFSARICFQFVAQTEAEAGRVVQQGKGGIRAWASAEMGLPSGLGVLRPPRNSL